MPPRTSAAVIRFVAVSALGATALSWGCASGSAGAQHGTISNLSAAPAGSALRCAHRVPREVCARCSPALVPRFKAVNDWCAEHDRPESQCLICHPDLTFEPAPAAPAGADLQELSRQGEDVPSLQAHSVPGKVTLFDFYAVWCAPCRKVDAHLMALLGKRRDLAVRKLNVVSWQTPLAERYLRDVPALPYVVVHGKDGRPSGSVSGLDLEALDRAITKASAP
jgi:thiol-disulfide isomerase/thioredoxin